MPVKKKPEVPLEEIIVSLGTNILDLHNFVKMKEKMCQNASRMDEFNTLSEELLHLQGALELLKLSIWLLKKRAK